MINIDYSKTGVMLLVLVPIVWVLLYALMILSKTVKKEFLIVYALKSNCIFIFFMNLILFSYHTFLIGSFHWKIYYSFGHWFNVEGAGTKLEFAYNSESFLFR